MEGIGIYQIAKNCRTSAGNCAIERLAVTARSAKSNCSVTTNDFAYPRYRWAAGVRDGQGWV